MALIFHAPLTNSLVPAVAGNPAVTFTRATTAYQQNHEGVLRLAMSGEARFQGARRVRNLITTNTQNFSGSGANWGITGGAMTFGALGPTGAADATTFTANGAVQQIYTTVNLQAGQLGVTSLWIRRKTGTGAVFFKLPDNSTVDITAALAGGTWRRFGSGTYPGAGSLRYIGVHINVSGDALELTYAQFEDVTGQTNVAPSEYVSNGVLAAPWHGSGVNGVKYFSTLNGNTVAANIVTEAAGAAIPATTLLGCVIEGAATNLCLASQVFGDALWTTKTNAIITDNNQIAPDGTQTADTYGANAASQLAQQILTSAQAYAFSVYMKRLTGTGAISMTPDNASIVATNVAPQINSSTWTRVWATAALPGGNAFPSIFIGTPGDSVALWGAQFEVGTDPTSYIPTATGSVARNVDVLTYVAASNFGAAVGTAYAEGVGGVTFTAPGGTRGVIALDVASYPLAILIPSSALGNYDGTGAVGTVNTVVKGVPFKAASAWSATTRSVVLNAGTVGTGLFDGSMNGSNIYVGNWSNSTIFGMLKNVKFYDTRLTDAELQSLTGAGPASEIDTFNGVNVLAAVNTIDGTGVGSVDKFIGVQL